MTFYMAGARIDENGSARGGKAGDQTGKEVCIQQYSNYWNGGWDCVLRYNGKRYKVVRNRMMLAMYRICTSNWVGYDQDERTTLYNYLDKRDWTLKSLTKSVRNQHEPVETDCSNLVACIANVGVIGIDLPYKPVPDDAWTGNLCKYLIPRSFDKIVTGIDFKTGKGLQAGDILLNENHHTLLFMGASKAGEKYIAYS